MSWKFRITGRNINVEAELSDKPTARAVWEALH
jgi:hypothetical protein